MSESSSRCSLSTIWRVLEGQKIDVFSMFFLDGPQDATREPFLTISRDLGSPSDPIGIPNVCQTLFKIVVFFCFGLGAPEEGPGVFWGSIFGSF